MSSSHAQLTAVPIAVQGNSVNIVQGNMGAQFITKAAQSIRPAGATGQIMLQVFYCAFNCFCSFTSVISFKFFALFWAVA